MPVPYNEWAAQKVASSYPDGPEKVTLLAIAQKAQSDGTGCYQKVSTLAKWMGKSTRTVQRHLRTLELNGALDIQYHGAPGSRSNLYFILCCREAPAVIKEKTYKDGKQLGLALPIKQELSDTFPVEGDIVSQDLRHGVVGPATQRHPISNELNLNKDSGKELKLIKKGDRMQPEQYRTYVAPAMPEPIQSDTEKLIRETIAALERGHADPTRLEVYNQSQYQLQRLMEEEGTNVESEVESVTRD